MIAIENARYRAFENCSSPGDRKRGSLTLCVHQGKNKRKNKTFILFYFFFLLFFTLVWYMWEFVRCHAVYEVVAVQPYHQHRTPPFLVSYTLYSSWHTTLSTTYLLDYRRHKCGTFRMTMGKLWISPNDGTLGWQ